MSGWWIPRSRRCARSTSSRWSWTRRSSRGPAIKGLDLLPGVDKKPLHDRVNDLDWTQGAGPKLEQLLHRA